MPENWHKYDLSCGAVGRVCARVLVCALNDDVFVA